MLSDTLGKRPFRPYLRFSAKALAVLDKPSLHRGMAKAVQCQSHGETTAR
jgi:hypothetical protein